jgi:hypothetical protein
MFKDNCQCSELCHVSSFLMWFFGCEMQAAAGEFD